jgi:ABC-type amino acid transport system permease subunit
MLGWLTCLVVLIALVGLIGDGPSYVEAAVFSVYLLPLASGVFYLRTASRMARGDQQIDNRTKWLAILIVVGFPLFPFALSCFPVFVAVGLMCRHALKHHYQAYCEVLNPPMSGTPEG